MSGVALFYACIDGKPDDAAREIRAGADVNWEGDEEKRTPLFVAARDGCKDLVRLLLDKGAAVDKGTTDGVTPLYVASQNGHLEVVRFLLDRGAAVSKAYERGHTPLYAASMWNNEGKEHLDVVRLLLDRGADADEAPNGGKTPLYIAAERGNLNVVRLLLDRGASVDKANAGSRTASSVPILTEVSNFVFAKSETPLLAAAKKGHKNTVRLLLDKGASLDKAKDNGVTPLYIASQEGYLDVVRLLLDRGASVDKDFHEKGETPLWVACEYGRMNIAQLLLERGAAIDRADNNGTMPVEIASKNGHKNTVRLLTDKSVSMSTANKEQERKEAALAEQVRAMQEELAALKAQKEASPKAAPLDDCRIHPSCLKEGPELGRGGFGVVLHGQLQLPGESRPQKVAIKKLSLQNPTEMQRTEFTFEVIATIQASRRCPHVLHCYGYSALSDGSLCLVMKYYEKGTLHNLINEQVYDPLPMKQVLRLALDIALGIEELHAARILIDDIKATNVLIDDDGGAVIADFGLSTPLVDKTHVSASVVAGTLAYMAPEKHASGDKVKFGFAADIWALGVTLAQIVAADTVAPWERGQGISDIIIKLVVKKQPPTVCSTPEMPGLQTLIQDCLQIEPRSRPSAYMVVKRLQKMATKYSGR